jgi:hypothetical protein
MTADLEESTPSELAHRLGDLLTRSSSNRARAAGLRATAAGNTVTEAGRAELRDAALAADRSAVALARHAAEVLAVLVSAMAERAAVEPRTLPPLRRRRPR